MRSVASVAASQAMSVAIVVVAAAAIAVVLAVAPTSVCGSSNPGGFAIVALPDTQYYASWWEDNFAEQTQWICRCPGAPAPGAPQLARVLHLGDIVQHANNAHHEWLVARDAMHALDRCDVRYSMLPGNHDVDYAEDADADRYEMYERTFPRSAADLDGSYPEGSARNGYRRYRSPAGRPYLFLSIEHLPPINATPVMRWAFDAIERHPDHRVVVSTHDGGNDCSRQVLLWMRKMIYEHCNVVLVLSGHNFHCGGEEALVVENRCGQERAVLISDYQGRPHGGDAWLRIYTVLEGDADGEFSLCVDTYSPALHLYESDENSYFSVVVGNGSRLRFGPGCSRAAGGGCASGFVSPGFLLGTVSIATTNVMLVVLMWTPTFGAGTT